MDLKEIVAANVRRLRLKRGLSQSELARRAKMDRPYLNRLEHGAHDPRLKFIAKIAAALKVEPAELLKTDGPQSPKRGSEPPPKPTAQWPKPVTSALKSRRSASPRSDWSRRNRPAADGSFHILPKSGRAHIRIPGFGSGPPLPRPSAACLAGSRGGWASAHAGTAGETVNMRGVRRDRFSLAGDAPIATEGALCTVILNRSSAAWRTLGTCCLSR
jgi:transcriptional regulator with XRE-family HTH domain